MGPSYRFEKETRKEGRSVGKYVWTMSFGKREEGDRVQRQHFGLNITGQPSVAERRPEIHHFISFCIDGKLDLIRLWRVLRFRQEQKVFDCDVSHSQLALAADTQHNRWNLQRAGLSYELWKRIIRETIPPEIVKLIFELEKSGVKIDPQSLNDEVKRGTLKWSRKLGALGVLSPAQRKSLLANYNRWWQRHAADILEFWGKFGWEVLNLDANKFADNVRHSYLKLIETGIVARYEDDEIITVALLQGLSHSAQQSSWFSDQLISKCCQWCAQRFGKRSAEDYQAIFNPIGGGRFFNSTLIRPS